MAIDDPSLLDDAFIFNNEIETDELPVPVPVSPLGSSYYGDPSLESSLHATNIGALQAGLDPDAIEEDEVDEGIISQTHADRTSHALSLDSVEDVTSVARGQPVGANSSPEALDHAHSVDIESASPERVFKIVFVGDSGVGKSSFIHRFCSNTFKSTFSATIGVDFQVKNIKVDGHIIALQLWDTAGQERFRSITKQYFRKADGVLIMYDVTSEASYKNVNNWMASVQDGTEESTVLLVAGNKMDLVDEEEDNRVIRTKDGTRLADEYGALFYETSAKSGLMVRECLEAMASLLREREDREMEKALNLTDKPEEKKRGCCN